jgi:hypothetical protein
MTPIYYITHIQNLALIAAAGALWCDRRVQASGLAPRSIAHGQIKARREAVEVPLPPHGCLAEYVPFYFCPRSPLLFAIERGQVPGHTSGQAFIAHLELDADALLTVGLLRIHTDGNAASLPRRFFDSRGGFATLSWDVIRAAMWRDTAEDNDRKRRKQAELLVHGEVPRAYAIRIGVLDASAASAVHNAVHGQPHQPVVEVRRDWYYT